MRQERDYIKKDLGRLLGNKKRVKEKGHTKEWRGELPSSRLSVWKDSGRQKMPWSGYQAYFDD